VLHTTQHKIGHCTETPVVKVSIVDSETVALTEGH